MIQGGKLYKDKKAYPKGYAFCFSDERHRSNSTLLQKALSLDYLTGDVYLSPKQLHTKNFI